MFVEITGKYGLIQVLNTEAVKTQSALNNFDEFTMLEAGDLASYVGFTEEEVKELCEKYHQNFAEIKRWHDGYLLEDYQVYNLKAIHLSFPPEKFPHLAGFQHLKDINLPRISLAKTMNIILSGKSATVKLKKDLNMKDL